MDCDILKCCIYFWMLGSLSMHINCSETWNIVLKLLVLVGIGQRLRVTYEYIRLVDLTWQGNLPLECRELSLIAIDLTLIPLSVQDSCYQTRHSPNQWMQVDLGQIYVIHTVVILRRKFQVMLSYFQLYEHMLPLTRDLEFVPGSSTFRNITLKHHGRRQDFFLQGGGVGYLIW